MFKFCQAMATVGLVPKEATIDAFEDEILDEISKCTQYDIVLAI